MKKVFIVGTSIVALAVIMIVGFVQVKNKHTEQQYITQPSVSQQNSSESKNTSLDEGRKVAVENMLRILDEKALTSEGKIKNYKIDEGYTKNNPMSGQIIRVIINDDNELDIETTLNKYPSRGVTEHGVINLSSKLADLVPPKGQLAEVGKITTKTYKEIAESEYVNNSVGRVSRTNNGYNIGYVFDVNDNRSSSGEQIYAIANVGVVPLNASLSERQKVKEITLLYKNNVEEEKISVEQMEASSDYLKEIIEKYPNAKINIYGHSLGSMNAQYALANVTDYGVINSGHIFNGRNMYKFLSYDQKINASALYSKVYNYIFSREAELLGYKEGEGAVGQVIAA